MEFYPSPLGLGQILVIKDHFTEYVALYLVSGKLITITRRFEEYLTRFGALVT